MSSANNPNNGYAIEISPLTQAKKSPQPSLRAVVDALPRYRQCREKQKHEKGKGGPAATLNKLLYIGTCDADEYEAQKKFGATQVQSAFQLSSSVRMTPIHIQ